MGRRTLSNRGARAVDAAVVIVSLYGVVREIAFPADGRRLFDLPIGVYVAVQIVGASTLFWRRSRPLAVGWVNAALCLISPTQASYFASYALGAHADRRRSAFAAFATVLAGWIVGAQLWNLEEPWSSPILLCLAGLGGLYVRARRALYDALEERALRAEREQEQTARAAVADERVRIANDMHDAVAHNVTLMVLQAGALSVAGPDSATRRSGDELRSRGVDALAELRDIIGVLRDDAIASTSRDGTQPSVEKLVADASASGVDVHLRNDASSSTTPQVATLVRRIVREALTNAIKHAPGSVVGIEVVDAEDETIVCVVNTTPAPGCDRPLAGSGAGSGLRELRRRVAEHGGRLHHARRADGGFELNARIPASGSRTITRVRQSSETSDAP